MCGAKLEEKFQLPKMREPFLNRPTIKRKTLESWDLNGDSDEKQVVKQPKLDTNYSINKNEKFIQFEPVKIMTYKSYTGGVFVIAHGYKVTPTAETNIILKGSIGPEAVFNLISAQSSRRPTRVAISSTELPLQPYEDQTKKAFKLL